MSIKRRGPLPTQRFTMIPNDWVRDERLSFRARGVLTYLLSHIESWETSVAKLASSGTEGRDAIQATIVELEDLGYLKREQRHGEAGKFAGVDYILSVSDTIPEPPSAVDGKPVNGSTVDGKPVDGKTADGKTAAKKTMSSEDHPTEHQSSGGKPPARRRKAQQQPQDPLLPVVIVEAAEPAATPETTGTQDLLGRWIEYREGKDGIRPPNRVIGHLSREIKNLLDEGQPFDDVHKGLALWDSRRLNPGSLASCVNEARQGPPPPRHHAHNVTILAGAYAAAAAAAPNPFMTDEERRNAK